MAGPMNIFDISGRAMSAQLVRMNATASNLANAGTVTGDEKTAYRAIKPVFQTITEGEGIATIKVDKVVQSDAQPVKRHDPGHPLADANGDVRAFADKQDAGGGTLNGGFVVFKRAFLDIAERHGDVMLEREPMDDLVDRGQLAAYRHPGFWEPMDTMREYRQLNRMWDSGEARWKIW